MKNQYTYIVLCILSLSLFTVSCKKDIQGCTDSTSNNYNPDATEDDNSCTYDIMGCTDANSDNYNAEATVDDGTCVIKGCTNPIADNYNADATEDDESCIVSGCTIVESDNYNPEATNDDGSCIAWADKFVGEYTVEMSCTNALFSAFNAPFDMVVSRLSDNQLIITLETTILGTIPISASIDNDTYTFNEVHIPELELSGFTIKDMRINGNGLIGSDKNITGTIIITIGESPIGEIADDCPMVAIRK